jgi:hypothetical protein
LDSAIPHLPQWANTPVLSGLTFDAQIQRAEKSGHPEQAEWLRKQKSLQDKAYQKNIDKHPIATGVGEGVGETAEGLTSPANLALMITAPESKIMSGLFAIQSLHGSYKDVEEARKAYREGRNAEASKYATQAVLNLGIAGLAGHHAVKDIPVPEGVKDFVKSEEGSVGPQGKVAPAKPDSKTESEPGYAYHDQATVQTKACGPTGVQAREPTSPLKLEAHGSLLQKKEDLLSSAQRAQDSRKRVQEICILRPLSASKTLNTLAKISNGILYRN